MKGYSVKRSAGRTLLQNCHLSTKISVLGALTYFNDSNIIVYVKLFQQGYRYHQLRKVVFKFLLPTP